MDTIWTGVRDRVLALRTAPGARRVFGATFDSHGHGFDLEPPVAEAALPAAESVWGVTLPEEYRTFLLEVGASGAGPDYGLLPLRLPRPGTPPSHGHLRRPFRPGTVMDLLTEHEEAEPRREDDADQAAFLRDYRVWEERYDQLDRQLTDGTRLLGHQGCGYYTLLAVTGPERGTLWNDVRAVGEGLDPVRLRGKERVTFAEWYLTWLDHAEREAWTEAPD